MAPYAPYERTEHYYHQKDPQCPAIHVVVQPLKRDLYRIPERFISFQDTVDIKPYHQFEKEDKNKIWYSKKELVSFKQHTRKAIRDHRGGFPPRGLEKRTNDGLQRALRYRVSSLAAVFRGQYVGDDPTQIAAAYGEVARQCQLEAIEIAARDQMEVASYQDDETEHAREDQNCFLIFPQWFHSLLSPPPKAMIVSLRE
eukprot:scaffold3924_cov109-Cylindrotheca_fusiformis.AAC.7